MLFLYQNTEMTIELDSTWRNVLDTEMAKPYFKNLLQYIDEEYKNYICYPKTSDIFKAFNQCLFEDVKVVIIGQDPYHGPSQANGLSFSVEDSTPHPPSLKNIFKELETDLSIPYPKTGNLNYWAKQGVLLLNATLTVRASMPSSHQNKGWEDFTNTVISVLSKNRTNIVFLLWGGFAKKKKRLINTAKHFILESGHPSPLSANRGYWFGNAHFSKTNSLLQQAGVSPIDWSLS